MGNWQILPEREYLALLPSKDAIFFPNGKMADHKITDPRELGTRIRQRRRELGLTQVALADVSRVTPRLVGELERGKSTAQLDGTLRVLGSLGLDLYLRTR